MKEYTFNVSVTEVYKKQITVTAQNETDAESLVLKELDQCPLDVQSGTLVHSDTDVNLYKIKE